MGVVLGVRCRQMIHQTRPGRKRGAIIKTSGNMRWYAGFHVDTWMTTRQQFSRDCREWVVRTTGNAEG